MVDKKYKSIDFVFTIIIGIIGGIIIGIVDTWLLFGIALYGLALRRAIDKNY